MEKSGIPEKYYEPSSPFRSEQSDENPMINKINEGEEMQKTKIKKQQTKPNQKRLPFLSYILSAET